MQRRSFIKSAGLAGLVLTVTPKGIFCSILPDETTGFREGFLSPPSSAKPYTFYLFMNGHIAAEGVTKDLEALSAAGIGGVLNYNAGIAIPEGPIEFFSKEWYELLEHTVNEAGRLGLEYIMHNCPGWSSSGGPWITPEMSMQQVVWSETFVSGGNRINQLLARPFHRINYYEDSFVVAFPSLPDEQNSWSDKLIKASTGRGIVPLENFSNGNGIAVAKPAGKNGYLLLEFSEPVEVEAIVLNGSSLEEGAEGIYTVGPLTLECSADGLNFKKIKSLGRISLTSTANVDFEPVKAKYLRLLTPASIRIDQLDFYKISNRLPNWRNKANFSRERAVYKLYQTAPYAGEVISPVSSDDGKVFPVKAEAAIRFDSIIDLTHNMDKEGKLNWDAPAGNWTILRFGHTSTGVTNRAAPDKGQGLECDKYNKEAFDQHFHGMFDKILPLIKTMAGRGKAGIEIDSYEVGMQNWTRKFPAEFKKSRNYDLVKYMPALTGRIIENQNFTEAFLWDARRVMADMMAENYYGRCAELCKKHNLIFYGEPYKQGPMDNIQAASAMENVMGEFWARGQRNKYALKLAASSQHLNGRKIVGAESYTGHAVYSKWQQYPFAMKAQGDFMFTKGLTRIIFHTSAHQPHPSAKPGMTMGPFGTHIDRNVTWFSKSKPWLTYLARCQYLLQQGLFVADLLYYTGEEAPGQDLALKENPVPDPPEGYDFDYINTELLLQKVSVKNGRIFLPDGMSYGVLFLPPEKTMSLRVAKKLRDLVKQGMKLVGPRPEILSGLVDQEGGPAALRNIAEQLWDNETQAFAGRAFGDGMVFNCDSAEKVLAALQIQKDFAFTSASSDPAINYIHRLTENGDLYFVGNRKRRFESIVCSFRISGKNPEFFDPVTGKTTPALLWKEENGRTLMPLHLHPSGSVFILFSEKKSLPLASVFKNGKPVINTLHLHKITSGKYQKVFNNFTQTVWLKPETDIALSGVGAIRREDIASFAFSPAQGNILYGDGHAICGATLGRNGIEVYEREDVLVNPVLEVKTPLSGWTHFALVYRNGAPSVYLNGKLMKAGKASGKKVHPCAEEEFQDVYSLFFEGDISKTTLYEKALSAAEIERLYSESLPERSFNYPDAELLSSGKSPLIFWKNGVYEFRSQNGKVSTQMISSLGKPAVLKGEWNVQFPGNSGAPSQITMAKLMSLHRHELEGVKHFSGTASYQTSFTYSGDRSGKEVYLDLGQVEVLAEVILNGINLGVLWLKPCRVNVTDAIRTGANQLIINVTNLWPNRLIGDEQFPEENEYSDKIFEGQDGYGITKMPGWFINGEPKPETQRTTFSTWKHYQKSDPLLESGLVGPVRLIEGMYYQQT